MRFAARLAISPQLSIYLRRDAANVATVVRSVVSVKNYESIPALGIRLLQYRNIRRWSLLEFTAVGSGYQHRHEYELPRQLFDETVALARAWTSGAIEVDAYPNEAKTGTYALITPDGHLYGTSNPANGRYPIVGNVLETHLAALAGTLVFDQAKHQRRYGYGL